MNQAVDHQTSIYVFEKSYGKLLQGKRISHDQKVLQ